jgi:hypothetical protein
VILKPSKTPLPHFAIAALHAAMALLLCLCVFGLASQKTDVARLGKALPALAAFNQGSDAVFRAVESGLPFLAEGGEAQELPNGYAEDCSSPESCDQFDDETPGIDDDEVFVVAPHHETPSMYLGALSAIARLNAITPRRHISELLRPPNF